MADGNKHKHEIIEGLLAGGVVGAALGAILTGKGQGTVIASLVGAAIGASLKALQEAETVSTPVLFEENGDLYQKNPDGSVEFVKQLPKQKLDIPKEFTLG